MEQHLLDLRRHREQRRHAVRFDRLERLLGLVAALDDVGAADHQMRNEERLHAADVVERRDVQRNVGRLQPVLHHAVHRDRDVVVVAVHHALRAGPSCRTCRRAPKAGRPRARGAADGRRPPASTSVSKWWWPGRHVGRVVCARDVVVDAAQPLLRPPARSRSASARRRECGRRSPRATYGDLARRQPEIERHGDRAQHLRREIGGDRVLGSRHVERDAVARAHAEIGERLREPATRGRTSRA